MLSCMLFIASKWKFNGWKLGKNIYHWSLYVEAY